jgi:hypothetical protein
MKSVKKNVEKNVEKDGKKKATTMKKNVRRGRPLSEKTKQARKLKAQKAARKAKEAADRANAEAEGGADGKAMKKYKLGPHIATGRKARNKVHKGSKSRTVYGLKKENLRRNRHGKIVSIKASETAKRRFAGGSICMFAAAVKEARVLLNIQNFQAVGGKTEQGQKLLQKARSIYRRDKELKARMALGSEKAGSPSEETGAPVDAPTQYA